MRTHNTTKWGKASFGGGKIPALSIALPVGIIISLLLGAIAIWTGISGDQPVVVFTIFAAVTVIPAVMLSYVIIVDDATIQGAVARPEESIEQQWFTKASSGTLLDLVLVSGVLLMILAFIAPIELDVRLVLAGVIGFAFVGTLIRYMVQRKRG